MAEPDPPLAPDFSLASSAALAEPQPSAPLFAPSDLAGPSPPAPVLVRVAGRVILDDQGALLLADALGSVRFHLEDGESPPAPGDLAVLEGLLRYGELRSAQVIERIKPARPPALDRAPAGDPPRSETERLLGRATGRALAARAAGLRAIRAFFEDRRFLEVDTPSLVPSPGLDVHLDAFEVPGGAGARGAGYLSTSPEYQMKRLLAGGIPRCFQLARCYRQGEVGRRHNPEFLMLEWYRAFATVAEVVTETEALVRHVASALGSGAELTVGGARVDLSGPFERLPVAEAFARYAGVSPDEALALASSDETRFFRLLVDEVEPSLAREPRPVFLVDYPAPFASLARLKPGDARVCERFELYVGGVELCNGFGELTDPREQRARFERDQRDRAQAGKPVYPIDERFLAALEEGMPPAAGNALGVDRLLALCLGAEEIAAVQAFPAPWLFQAT